MVRGLKYIVLAFNIVYFTVLALALPLTFEENDDVMMAMIANGSYSGTPDCHLVYINVIYGWVLTLLYGLTRAIEWYTLSFAVLHVLSGTQLLRADHAESLQLGACVMVAHPLCALGAYHHSAAVHHHGRSDLSGRMYVIAAGE